jgi:Ca2+-binding RTX toxin-like protein
MPSFRRLAAACATTAAATLTATAAFAPPAHAAAAGKAAVSGRTIVFTAAAGARNLVFFTRSGRTVTIDDRVAIKAGSGCKAVKGDKTKVKCTTAKNPTLLRAVLGDKDDHLHNRTAIATTVGGGAGNDQIQGGSATNRLDGGPGDDSLYGGKAADYLVGGAGKNHIVGDAGDDTLVGGTGHDYLSGGAGNDELLGAAGPDQIHGDAGNDVVDGGTNADHLYGGSGDDILDGGTGRDRLLGESGDDTLTTQPADMIPDPESSPVRIRPEEADGGASGSDFCDVLSTDTVVNCELVTELDNLLLTRQFAALD